MSRYALRVLALADGRPFELAGGYLRAFDVDANGGRGSADLTADPSLALTWPTPIEAFAAWKSTSTVRPIRPDGKPNRPLTAYTVEVVDLDGSQR